MWIISRAQCRWFVENDVSTIRYLQNLLPTTSLPSSMMLFELLDAHEMCTWNSHELHLVEIDWLAKLNQRLGIEIEMLKSSNSKCPCAARLRNFVTEYFTCVHRIATEMLQTKIRISREISSRLKRHSDGACARYFLTPYLSIEKRSERNKLSLLLDLFFLLFYFQQIMHIWIWFCYWRLPDECLKLMMDWLNLN